MKAPCRETYSRELVRYGATSSLLELLSLLRAVSSERVRRGDTRALHVLVVTPLARRPRENKTLFLSERFSDGQSLFPKLPKTAQKYITHHIYLNLRVFRLLSVS